MMLEKLQKEIVLVGGLLVAGGELALRLLPAGPVRSGLMVVIPLVAAVVARARVIPVKQLEQWWSKLHKETKMADLTNLNNAVAALQSAAQSVEQEIQSLKAGATDQAAVDAATSQVEAVTQGLQAAVTPPAA